MKMDDKTLTTTEVLNELDVPFWRLEYLIKSHQIKPLGPGGRGVERRFSVAEFEKIKRLLAERHEPQYA